MRIRATRFVWRSVQIKVQVAFAGVKAFSGAMLAPKRPFSNPATSLYRRFQQPIYALPLDLFRIGFGLISTAYFWRTYREIPTISSPDGYIDHQLSRKVFWFTKVGLFHPGLNDRFFRVVYLGGIGGSLLLTVGWRVRLSSTYLFGLAMATFRWNFMAVYVDDAIMHILYFWMMVLPLGRTLNLPQLITGDATAVARWPEEQVSGTAPRLLLANLSLLYLVAGLWKWTSPLWRRGLALYAALKTPASRHPAYWKPIHLPLLVPGNFAALFLEPVLPLMLALPTHHKGKWALGLGLVGFHSGIIATLKIPFANAVCISATPLFFREEIMGLWGRHLPEADLPQMEDGLDPLTGLAAFVVANLVLAMVWDATRPTWRSGPHMAEAGYEDITISPRHNPFYGVLWLLGIAQSYRLFDWIDVRNYFIQYEVNQRDKNGRLQPLPWTRFFPPTVRNVLLHTYLHDINWLAVPRHLLPEVQKSLMIRIASDFCRRYPDAGLIEINTIRARITPDNLDGKQHQITPFMIFECHNGNLVIHLLAPTNRNPVDDAGQN